MIVTVVVVAFVCLFQSFFFLFFFFIFLDFAFTLVYCYHYITFNKMTELLRALSLVDRCV